jgi:hypothetical protein
VLSLHCTQCSVLVCRACVDGHLASGHRVVPMEVASREAVGTIGAGLPELWDGLIQQLAQSSQARSALETLKVNRLAALEALASATARLHAEMDARHAVLVADIDAAYAEKVAGWQHWTGSWVQREQGLQSWRRW